MKCDMGGAAAVIGAMSAAADLKRAGAGPRLPPDDRQHARRRRHAGRRRHAPLRRLDDRGAQHRRRGPADPRRRPRLRHRGAQRPRPPRRRARSRHPHRRLRGRPGHPDRRRHGQRRRPRRPCARRRRAGRRSRSWRLPLAEVEKRRLESKVADRKNTGHRYGGAHRTPRCSSATSSPPGTPWAHLDIAGPAFNEGTDDAEIPAGGTGFGVRTCSSSSTLRLSYSAASASASASAGCTSSDSTMSLTRRWFVTATAMTEMSSAAWRPTIEPPSTTPVAGRR